MDSVIRAFVGVDWATDNDQVCVVDRDGKVLGERSFRHSPQGLQEHADWLGRFAEGEAGSVLVAIEVPHGPVVEFLVERGFRVHSINPKQLDRFRDRFTVAGAKDDRLDARVLADSLRTDRRHFRLLEPEEPLVIQIREASRMAEDLQRDITRLANQWRQQLQRYYPGFLEVSVDPTREWVLDLWELAPVPGKRLRKSRIQHFLSAHQVHTRDVDEIVVNLSRSGFQVASGTVEAAIAHLRLLTQRIRLAIQQIKTCHKQLDELTGALTRLPAVQVPATDPTDGADEGQVSEQHDVEILRSLPGVGRIVLAVLLAEAWRLLQARDYTTLRAYAGAAPVTRQSGRKKLVVMRTACNPRLRNALYHWARVACQTDPCWKTRYAALRARGHHHGRTLRTVGDRLLHVACTLLETRIPYDPGRLRRAA